MNPNAPVVLCELDPTSDPSLESYSPFCLKVHRALKAAALPYERRHGSNPSAFKALNPIGQVPVLLLGDEAISDSTRIVERIVALRPGLFGADLDASARAEAWLWEDFADTSLNGYLVASRWLDDRNWDTVRQAYFGRAPWFVRALIAPRIRNRVRRTLVARDVWRAGSEACWRRFVATLDQLEARAPARGYWLGPALTVADISMFAQLRSLRTDLTAWQKSEIEQRGALRDWLDRVDRATTGEALPAPRPAREAA
jgi:glutathione S-transferase